MIKTVTAINYLREEVKIKLSDMSPSHGLIITDMSGLGPPKANINTTTISSGDGSIYNSARLDDRNITINLLFVDAPSIEAARQNTYRYFPVKKPITLKIDTDNRSVYTVGYVESNEPTIFSDKESCQISIICPDSHFYSNALNETVFYGIEPDFEFPFSNESLSENLLNFGNIMINKARNIYYDGDDEIGIVIKIHALGDISDITIWNTKTKEKMKIYADKLKSITGSALKNGDDLIINTEDGHKSVKLLRDGKYTNIINCIDRFSDWFKLSKGSNTMAFEADDGNNNIVFKIENKISYEGI